MVVRHWTGGLFPVLDGKVAEDCRTQPTVGFGKDLVTHASLLGGAMSEQTIETVRTTPTGAEFRFTPGGDATSSFGCETPNVLHVARGKQQQDQLPALRRLPLPARALPAPMTPGR